MIELLGKYARYGLTFGAFSLWSAMAMAQSSDENGLKITIAPYLWATAIDGTSAIGDLPPLDLDISFDDLVSNLDLAMSFHTEFRVNDWVFAIDPTYVSLEIEVDAPPIPGVESDIVIDVKIWMVELWTGYRLTSNWEVLGGLRYQSVDLEVSGLPNPPFPDVVADESWTDWFVGPRFNMNLGSKWFVSWRADVIFAGDSDDSWNTSIFFNRRIGDSSTLKLGYRYFSVDFKKSNPTYVWDVSQDGPVIGYSWTF